MKTCDALAERLQRIQALVLDVDGVLTDGSIVYAGPESEAKSFSVRDGFALQLWRRRDKKCFVITGRRSAAVERRCRELGVAGFVQGADSKVGAFRDFLAEHRLERTSVLAMGDDWPDLPLLIACGVAAAVPEAHEEIRSAADYVTKAAGGKGAVAEVVEMVLRAQGTWAAATEEYRRPA